MNRTLTMAAFAAGLAVVCWTAAGYIGNSPVALGVTLIIAAAYLAGALELLSFDRATRSLRQTLNTLSSPPAELGGWLAQLPPSLQNPVRLRIEGERTGLPAPVLTPYLVGLLVLLGMLGTFLGMVLTLNGAFVALEHTTDLQAIRSALAAPVKGLGVAFGTSIAGVAASAMLGLMSVLCRRARLQAAQQLEARIATTLREFSLTHQRQQTFRALQGQAEVLPRLVDALQSMMDQLNQRSEQSATQLAAAQAQFHDEARASYTGLAAAVDQSLKDSLSAGARLAGETLQPAVEATMRAIAAETTALQSQVADTVTQHLNGVSARFDDSISQVSARWTTAVDAHTQGSAELVLQLQHTLDAHARKLEQDASTLLESIGHKHTDLCTQLTERTTDLARETGKQQQRLIAAIETQLDALGQRVDAGAQQAAHAWQAAASQQTLTNSQLGERLEATLTDVTNAFAEQSTRLASTLHEQAQSLQAGLASRDDLRLATQQAALDAMTTAAQQSWKDAASHASAEQNRICSKLEETAQRIATHTEAQTAATLSQVSQLMQTAAEAPRAAADVITQLRQELSASIARDNEMLVERSRIMETLGGLLDAINHAATEQRAAIDALVGTAADLLERTTEKLQNRVDAEATRMGELASQLDGSAVEVASLGEAMSAAVEQFGTASAQLAGNLQRIEAALDKSLNRSDEQMAYYVAQAREIIDLSMMSQQRIVDDLQQIKNRPAALADEV